MIEKRQHNLFVAMDIRGRLDAIVQCYEVGEGVAHHGPNTLVARAQAKTDLSGSFADLIVKDVINAESLEFYMTRVEGHAAQKAIAVLCYFSLHPERHGIAMILEEMFEGERIWDISAVPTHLVPPMDVAFYLTHPRLAGTAAIITAKAAGRVLRERGKALCLEASSADGIEQYHVSLHSALLAYRGALEVYQTLKDLGSASLRCFNEAVEDCASLRNMGKPL
ncbi:MULTISPECIES: hypothetical protein [Rhizobium]|nr:hypothetical protein [Rhizobium hidalgonense]UWU39052.1 hypothetical protein N2597_33645 [Rhizobium leguminosarum bv. phaseoli]